MAKTIIRSFAVIGVLAGVVFISVGLATRNQPQVIYTGNFAHFEIDDPDYYQSALASPYQPSEQIEQLASQMGLTAVGQELFFEARPQLTDGPICQRAGISTTARGCFTRFSDGKTRITIAELDDPGILVEVVAHELLHAVYYDLSETKKTEVKELIDTAYSRNQVALDRRLKPYGQLPTDNFYSELHSFIGSTITDIPAPLEAHFGRYFTDRIGLVINFKPNNQAAPTGPKPAPPNTTTEFDPDCNLSCQIEKRTPGPTLEGQASCQRLNWNYNAETGVCSKPEPGPVATTQQNPTPPSSGDDEQWGDGGQSTLPDIDPNLSCIAKLGVLADSMQARGASLAAVVATLTDPGNIPVFDQNYSGCYNEWLPTIESWRAADTNASEAADRQRERLMDTLREQSDNRVELRIPEPVY